MHLKGHYNHKPTEYENGKFGCARCGGQFNKDELQRCPVCGFYFCEGCITHHHCVTSTDGTILINDDNSIERDKTHPINESNTRAICAVCGKPKLLNDLIKCEICGNYFCHDCYPQHYKDEIDTAKWIKCDGCGQIFKKSKMKRCKCCGKIYCRKCRKNHVCSPTDI